MAAVETQYEEEVNEIGEEISVIELDKAAARITAKLHDGHTYVAWINDDEARYIDDFTQLWSYGEPISIDGIPVEEMLTNYKETASYEREEYEKTLASFFEEVEKENIQNVVVDLRGNGGGNSWVANEFITYLDVDKYQGCHCW